MDWCERRRGERGREEETKRLTRRAKTQGATRRRGNRGGAASSSGDGPNWFGEYDPSAVPVYDGESVEEFCARLAGKRDSGAELLWGTILLPESEIIQALTTTKPWQIDLKGGRELLLLRLPVETIMSDELRKYMQKRVVVEKTVESEIAAIEEPERKPKPSRKRKEKPEEPKAKEDKKASDATKQVRTSAKGEGPSMKAISLDAKKSCSMEEYDLLQKTLRKTKKQTASNESPSTEPKAPPIKVSLYKSVIEQNRLAKSKRPVRALSDLYDADGAPAAGEGLLKANRKTQRTQRKSNAGKRSLADLAEESNEDTFTTSEIDMELAEQLTMLADAALPTKRQKKRQKKTKVVEPKPSTHYTKEMINFAQNVAKSSKAMGAEVDVDVLLQKTLDTKRSMIAATQGLPGAVPLSRVKAVIVKTATIGEVFKPKDEYYHENPNTMLHVQRNTIGSVYYVGLVHEALEDVSLVPSRFLLDKRRPVKI